MIKLRIVKDREWGEYIVEWRVDGKIDKEKSAYTGGLDASYAEDAVNTAIAMIDTAREHGESIEFNDDNATKNLISKYRPDFLVAEARRSAKAAMGTEYVAPRVLSEAELRERDQNYLRIRE